jgi:hypothetical protein
MAALVQSYPSQSNTITMLQTRPSSASGMLQTNQQGQMHQQYASNTPMNRTSFHGMGGAMVPTNYRGHTSLAPMSPYGYSMPVSSPGNGQRPPTNAHLRTENRTASAPSIPMYQPNDSTLAANRSKYPPAPSTTSSSSSEPSTGPTHGVTRDDTALLSTARAANRTPRPHSTIITSATAPGFTPPILSSPAKASPDRYRRRNNSSAASSGSASPSGTGMAAVNQLYTQQYPIPAFNGDKFNLQMPQSSNKTSSSSTAADDMSLPRHTGPEPAKRYRRRSIHTVDMGSHPESRVDANKGSFQPGTASPQLSITVPPNDQHLHPLRSSPVVTVRPTASHGRHGSTDSVGSARSSKSNSNANSTTQSRQPSPALVSKAPHRPV